MFRRTNLLTLCSTHILRNNDFHFRSRIFSLERQVQEMKEEIRIIRMELVGTKVLSDEAIEKPLSTFREKRDTDDKIFAIGFIVLALISAFIGYLYENRG